jgi:hypothetical protein
MRFKDLVDPLTEAVEAVAETVAELFETEPGYVFTREPCERNLRFGSGTDGAVGCDVYVPLTYLESTGHRTGVEKADAQIEKLIDHAQKSARSLLAEGGEVKDWDAYTEEEKEDLDDLEREIMEDMGVTFRVMAFLYLESSCRYRAKDYLESRIVIDLPSLDKDYMWEGGDIIEIFAKKHQGVQGLFDKATAALETP